MTTMPPTVQADHAAIPRAAAPPRRPNFSRQMFRVAAACVCLALAATAIFRGRSSAASKLPVLGELPAFQLIERSGRRVDAGELRGHVWIADFFFTNCPGPCLTMTRRMAEMRRQLPPSVRFASITVDPQTDQPPVLSRYAARFGVADGDDGWLFLTGGQESIYRLAREGFHLAASGPAEVDFRTPDAAPLAAFLHSTRFALVDRDGRLRGIYDSVDENDLRRLAADVQTLR